MMFIAFFYKAGVCEWNKNLFLDNHHVPESKNIYKYNHFIQYITHIGLHNIPMLIYEHITFKFVWTDREGNQMLVSSNWSQISHFI